MWLLSDKLVCWHAFFNFYFKFNFLFLQNLPYKRTTFQRKHNSSSTRNFQNRFAQTQNTKHRSSYNSFPKCLTHTCWAANLALSCIADGFRLSPRWRRRPWWVSQTPSTLSIHDLKKTCQSGFCKSESLELICLFHTS